ncbi:MAG: hypothetical protein GXP21_06655 [Gammaproteobacteria bacterium]|nr:hypothetical protein [Gammaproteobacteria bacterium]
MNAELMSILSLLSILGIVVVLFWLYPDYLLDKLRQDLFSLRDDLFDQAVENNIPFDHDAYGMLRSTMNGVIRYSHRISFLHMVAFLLVDKTYEQIDEETFDQRLERKISNLDADQREIIRNVFFSMNVTLVKHFIMTPPFIMLAPILGWVYGMNKIIGRLVNGRLKEPLGRFDLGAYAEGAR